MKPSIIIAGALILVSFSSFSQIKQPEQLPRPIDPQRPPDQVKEPAKPVREAAKFKCELGDEASISNNVGKDIYFSYSTDKENWTSEKLEKNKIINISGVLSTKTYFKITTTNTEIIYGLKNWCYYIDWNREKGVWDLFEYKN